MSGKIDWLGLAITVFVVFLGVLLWDVFKCGEPSDPGPTKKPPQSSCSVQGTSAWPLASDPDPGQLYFQLDYDDYLHLGIDLPTPPNSEVRAIESGTVEAHDFSTEGYGYILVRSALDTTKGILYQHVTSLSSDPSLPNVPESVTAGMPFALTQVYTGDGCTPGDEPCYPHLHVERVLIELVELEEGGNKIEWSTAGNPLESLLPYGDTVPPVVEELPPIARPTGCGSGLVQIALLENQSPDQFLCPDELQDGQEIDVIIGVTDRSSPSSVWKNAPFCARLLVRRQADGEVAFRHSLRLEGPQEILFLPPSQYVYHMDEPLESHTELEGDRKLYLVVTNDVFADGFWPAEAHEGSATPYEITVEVSDSTGNQTTVSISATVHP